MTATFYCYSQSALRLQGIIDFDLTSGGYTGKAVHLFVGTSINDLSQYGIELQIMETEEMGKNIHFLPFQLMMVIIFY